MNEYTWINAWVACGNVYVKFAHAPERWLLDILKQAGFRWEGTCQHWVCPVSEWSLNAARRVAGHVAGIEPTIPYPTMNVPEFGSTYAPGPAPFSGFAYAPAPGPAPFSGFAYAPAPGPAYVPDSAPSPGLAYVPAPAPGPAYAPGPAFAPAPAPTDYFDYAGATEAQRQAIRTTEGPLLITAGPGTGKTKTLVTRVMYLIQERGVKPSQIMVVTYTVKAAKELLTRIANEASRRGIEIDVQDMYLGNFHSICLRLLKEYAEYANLPKSFGIADEFVQKYQVYLKLKEFEGVENAKTFGLWASRVNPDRMKLVHEVGDISDRLIEEGVDIDALAQHSNPHYRVYGVMAKKYFELLESKNLLDFAQMQVRAFELLSQNEEVLKRVREQVSYVMVDEYQDTNHIQEQLAFLISDAEHGGNLCVVGDDDQSLYRFRGATVRNILEFRDRFGGACAEVRLETNFRSNPQIVDFCRMWIEGTQYAGKHAFDWQGNRLSKCVRAYDAPRVPWPQDGKAVVRLTAPDGDANQWHARVYELLRTLKDSGKISDYNQVTFLFSSVAKPSSYVSEYASDPTALADYLESQNPPIHVYSPRSGAYFSREEVRLALGMLLHVFPSVVANGLGRQYSRDSELTKYWPERAFQYLQSCYQQADFMLSNSTYPELGAWVNAKRAEIAQLKDRNADFAFPELLYQMFAYEPFRTCLDTDVSAGMYDMRPVSNLAILVDMLVGFQDVYGIKVLRGAYIDDDLSHFAQYLARRIDERTNEREDERVVLPSGCVSFMTIHQAKGMEFPVTFVDVSSSTPWGARDDDLLGIVRDFGSGLGKEDPDRYDQYDFWRKYYVAFSRAQDLLVLSNGAQFERADSCFRWLWDGLPELRADDYRNPAWLFAQVGESDLRETYSFTSDVAVYETCPRQYKFQKVLGFPGVRTASTLFGTVVHQTIEDVHNAVMRGEWEWNGREDMENRVRTWFSANYESLSTMQHEYLGERQRAVALDHVLRYVRRRGAQWSDICEPEVKVSYLADDYIITGNVDLIQGSGDTVELVDFKSESRAKLEADPARLERYKRQLRLYAYLVEQRDPTRTVSRVHLYCTGTPENGNPWITDTCSDAQFEQEARTFDETVRKIQAMKFSGRCKNKETCANCDFRWYCG